MPRPLTRERLLAAREATLAAFRAEPDVVYQPAFFDGEFFGYADFVERTESGWLCAMRSWRGRPSPQPCCNWRRMHRKSLPWDYLWRQKCPCY